MKFSVAWHLARLNVTDVARYQELIHLRLTNPATFARQIQDLTEEFEELEKRDPTIAKLDADAARDSLLEWNADDVVGNRIIYVPSYLNRGEALDLVRLIYGKIQKLVFPITRGTALKGRLISEVFTTTQHLKVSFYGEPKLYSDTPGFWFIGALKDARSWVIKDTVEGDFWIYRFEANDRGYLAFSEIKRALGSCIVEGLELPLEDQVLIGSSLRQNVTLPFLFLHSVHYTRPQYKSHAELIDALRKLSIDGDRFYNWLFTWPGGDGKISFRQPPYFEKMVAAFLLSASVGGFPLHLFIVARQHTGKSTIQEAIHSHYPDEGTIFEGSESTLKGLIPSFKGNLPEPGQLLRANRLMAIDEFLRLLLRVPKEERDVALASMNTILEHRPNRTASSGNGFIRLNMTARVFAVSNPIWGCSDFQLMTSHIDPSFLSRWLIWYQDPGHIKWVNDQKGKEPTIFSISPDIWAGIVDYCHSFKAVYDPARLEEIYQEGLALIGEDTEESTIRTVREIYEGRYHHHHLPALMDGIIKQRCICQLDPTFKATDVDYDLLRLLIRKMVVAWGFLPANAITKSVIEQEDV